MTSRYPKMKVILLLAAISVACATPLLGTHKCTYGPAYWCSDLSHAKECQTIKHCLLNTWKQSPHDVQSDTECSLCKVAVSEARTLLQNNGTEEEIVAFMEKACEWMPSESYRTQCKTIVDQYLPELLQLLASDVDPQTVCSLIGLCQKTQEEAQKEAHVEPDVPSGNEVLLLKQAAPIIKLSLVATGSDICADCKKFFSDIKQIVMSNKTEADLEQYIDNMICSKFGPLKHECITLVSTFAPQFLQYLAGDFDPNVVCQMLTFCPSGSAQLQIVPKTSLADTYCDDCLAFMKDMQGMITSKTMESQLEDLFDGAICQALGPLADECKSLVQQLVPQMLQMLAAQFQPQQICDAMQMCSGGTAGSWDIQTMLTDIIKNTKHAILLEPQSCTICKDAVTEIRTLIKQQSIQDEVKAVLEQYICSMFGAQEQACKTAVENYLPLVFEVLATELDPQTVCTAFGLCATSDAPKLLTVGTQTSLTSDTKCGICEFVLRELDNLLKDKATEEEIIAAVDMICSIMPATIRDQCDSFVEEYGTMVINMLVQELDPKTVCLAIGLCQGSPIVKLALNIRGSEGCDVCKLLIGYVSAMVKDKATVAEIEKLLDEACGLFPDAAKNECVSIVSEYGPFIAQLLAQYINPSQICKEIGLCASTKTELDNTLYFQSRRRVIGQ